MIILIQALQEYNYIIFKFMFTKYRKNCGCYPEMLRVEREQCYFSGCLFSPVFVPKGNMVYRGVAIVGYVPVHCAPLQVQRVPHPQHLAC